MEPQPLPTSLTVPHEAGQLLCRLPALHDIAHLVEACQDPEIPRWTVVPSPYGHDDARRYVEFSAAQWGLRTGLHLLITPGADHVLTEVPLLGTVGCGIDWSAEEASVGYWIHAGARGHGVASTATAGLCRWLLNAGMRRLRASVLDGNVGSDRTLTKVGFQLEGKLRHMAAGSCGIGQDRIDELQYGLLPGELVDA